MVTTSLAGYEQDANCLPPISNGPTSTFQPFNYNIGHYSPGIMCPAGYQTACAMQVGSDGIPSSVSHFQSYQFYHTITAGETAVGCCPTGYQCGAQLGDGENCQHIIASTTLPVTNCYASGSDGRLMGTSVTQVTLPTIEFYSVTDLSTASTKTFNFTTMSMHATMVQMVFQATDIASISPSVSSASVSSTLLPPANNTSTDISATGSSSNNYKTTTIAVSVVTPCVVALMAASMGWFWYRRRRAKTQASASSYYAPPSAGPPSDSFYDNSRPSTEMFAQSACFEMELPALTHQMSPGTFPSAALHEMDAGNKKSQYRD